MENLTFKEVLTAIGTIAFPAIMCLLMWFKGTQVIDRTTTAVDKNTEAVNKLCECFERNRPRG